jgi:hypothetical protein
MVVRAFSVVQPLRPFEGKTDQLEKTGDEG